MISDLFAYFILFVTSFISSSFFPMTSDGVVAYMVLKNADVISVVLVASFGSYLGFCSIYAIGYFGREVLINKIVKIKKDKIEKAEAFFKKYGSWSLLFAWLPIIGEAFVAVSGIFRMNFLIFSILAFLGTFVRFAAIAYALFMFK